MGWVKGAVFYPLPDEEVRVEVELPSSIKVNLPQCEDCSRTYTNAHIIDAVTSVLNWELIDKFDITSIVSHFRVCVVDRKIQ
jgi:hypothetical protein